MSSLGKEEARLLRRVVASSTAAVLDEEARPLVVVRLEVLLLPELTFVGAGTMAAKNERTLRYGHMSESELIK